MTKFINSDLTKFVMFVFAVLSFIVAISYNVIANGF